MQNNNEEINQDTSFAHGFHEESQETSYVYPCQDVSIEPYETNHVTHDIMFQNTLSNMVNNMNIKNKKRIYFTTAMLPTQFAMEMCGSVINTAYVGECLDTEHVDPTIDFMQKDLNSLLNGEVFINDLSGSNSNVTACLTLANKNDTILTWGQNYGAHFSQGSSGSILNLLFNLVQLPLHGETNIFCYEILENLCKEHRPKVVILGSSSYTRLIDWPRVKKILDKYESKLIVDFAHQLGLMFCNLIPWPQEADIITGSTYKTIPGLRGGFIFTKHKELKEKIHSVLYQTQGDKMLGVMLGTYAAIRTCFTQEFKKKMKYAIDIAKHMEHNFKKRNYNVLFNSTETHMLCIDICKKTSVHPLSIIKTIASVLNICVALCKTNVSSTFYGLRFICTNCAILNISLGEIDIIIDAICYIIENYNALDSDVVTLHQQKIQPIINKYPFYI